MSRLSILTVSEAKAFDRPPQFTLTQRRKYFGINSQLARLLKYLRSDTNRVCMVLQWGYFRATGRFFSVNLFRESDINYVTTLFNIHLTNVSLDSYREKRKICRDHQNMILKSMGFRALTGQAKTWFHDQMESLVAKHMRPRDIIYYLASQCYQQKIEIPNYHYFSEHITECYNDVEQSLTSAVRSIISSAQKKRLDELLDEREGTPIISQWKIQNQKLLVKHIQSDIILFTEIKSCFYVLLPLIQTLNLNVASYEYYATWIKKAKISQLKQIPNKSKLYLHLTAFVQHQFYMRQDTLVDIFLKSVQTMRNRTKQKCLANEQSQQPEKHRLINQLIDVQDHLELLVSNITDVVNVDTIRDDTKINKIKILLQNHQDLHSASSKESSDNGKLKLRKLFDDNMYFSLVEEISIALQRRVANIVKSIDFDEETSDKSIMAAITYYKTTDGNLSQNVPTEFLNKMQRDHCYDNTGKLRVSLYKALLFFQMAEYIKSGHLNVKYSYRYKAIQDYLIPKAKWDSEKTKLLDMAGLSDFYDSKIMLSSLKDTLAHAYQRVNSHVIAGENDYIQLRDDGSWTLSTPGVIKENNGSISELFNDSGFVPIIQILNDTDRLAKYTDCFKHFSIKHQKLKPTPATIIAGIMAKGHNIGINKISHISIGINNNTLRQTVNWFFSNKNILMANQKIISMINKLSLTKLFSEQSKLTHTSSDGQKYQVAIDSLLANHSFKYFGKDKGVSVYTFIDDKCSLFYSTVISASEREAAYVIDGLLHNDVIKSDVHSTDMHGFTETIFAATHFMGTSFAPRFKKLSKQRIYSFSAKQTYMNKGYKILPSRIINQTLIHENWDDILRFMVTIKLKEASASVLLKRLSSYAKDHPLYKAIKEFGRIIKTQYILSYIDDVTLRQRVEKQLNRVELSNKFSKAIFFDKDHEFTVATREEQEVIANCKSLIQNAIVLWNYLYLSQLVVNTANQRDKAALLKIIQNSSMLTWQHVNMRGEYDFTKSSNSALFDLGKILSLKIESAVS